MALFLRRLAKAAPLAFTNTFKDQPKSSYGSFQIPFGAIAAVSGGISYYYYFSSPNMVYLDHTGEKVDPKVVLNPDKWVKVQLQDNITASQSTKLLRFSFDPTAKLGLDVCSYIVTRAPLDQDAEGKPKDVIRSYTPMSDPNAKGYFDLLVKVYPQGKMSRYLGSLKPGDVLEVKGPFEMTRYTPNMKKNIGMIAGGSGLTPMLQIIETILNNPDDNTQVSLLYANASPEDTPLKERLDTLAESHPNLKVFYTVDNPSKNWKGGVGYISKDMIIKGLPKPSEDTLILVCGPPGMMKQIGGDKAKDLLLGEQSGLLKQAGYTEEMVYLFNQSDTTNLKGFT